MIIKRSILLFIILQHAALSAQSLSETINIVIKNNAAIQAEMQAITASEKELEADKAMNLPTIDFDASYRHITHVAEMDIAENLPPALQGGFPAFQLGNYDSYDLGLSVNYLLFSGFARKNSNSIKNEQLNLSKNRLKKTKKEIAFQAAAIYRKIQGRYFEISALDSARKRTEYQLQRLKTIVEQGMALSLDTLELTLAKLSYLQKIIAAKSALESENEILNNLAGQRIKVEPLAQFSFSGAEEDRFFEKDERLQSLKIRKNILKFKKELSASSYYPTIALNAAYKYGDPGADIIQREWMSYGVWGVGIHWNLFRWGADKKAIEAGDAAVRELEYHYQDVSEKIKSDFMKTKRELASLKAQLDVLRTALHIAGEKLHIIDSRYKQGMASAADYNDANLNLAETELKYKQFLSAVALKINELDYKSGKPLQQWRLEQ